MWLVRLALRRPYTIAVLALLILIGGALSISSMLVDVFPPINIPVVAVVWSYNGLSAQDMERRVVLISERAYSTTVNGIQSIQSRSEPGIGLLKIYFQPGTDLGAAIAQISSVSSTIQRILPPGITPPNVIRFNASNLPVVQMTISSKTLPEQELFDYGLNFIRVRLFTIPGLSTPAPFGGKQRQIMIDADPRALAARGLSPADIVNALQTSNVILPAGTARMGTREYNILLNSSPSVVRRFEEIPIQVVGHRPVLLGDVAHVSDSFAEQNNIVHVNGKRATYLTILKHSNSSTLAVVEATKKILPSIERAAPHGMRLNLNFDQSVFVRAAIKNVIREALLSSILVSVMILLFLGSWRGMLMVATSIPLAILTGIVGLNLTHQTINIMTLGGLALAIGMLVDDATVAVESIHRHVADGKGVTPAIMAGAQEIAVPAIVATLAICIVFFPVMLLTGAAKFLFIPLALAVVIAMLASYFLSRTLVPLLARSMMPGELKHHGQPRTGWLARANAARERGLDRLRESYGRVLQTLLHHRLAVIAVTVVLLLITLFLAPTIGTDFFPSADVGLMKLHFRAPIGTRIEDTSRLTRQVEDKIRQVVPPSELGEIDDMIGVPVFYNLAFVQTDNVGGMDAEILISLKPHHKPTASYMRILRRVLPRAFPGCSFYFEPADIISQVLNFGLTSPIDVQVQGMHLQTDYAIAQRLQTRMQLVPGAVDVHIKEALDYPSYQVMVDRQRAAELGLTERDVANNLLTSLSSSSLVAPSFFLNPANGVNYVVAVQTPYQRVNSVPQLMQTPMQAAVPLLPPQTPNAPASLPEPPAQTLADIATIHPVLQPTEIDHETVQRVIDVDASVQNRDLGSVVAGIRKDIASLGKLPPGVSIHIRGQYVVMRQSFSKMFLGLLLAIALVYLLMVVLFQSWMDPFIIMMAVPGVLIGILWMLALTHTTVNVESLMGSIMAIGIATSNSILLVSYANDLRTMRPELTPLEAALEAGKVRLRPVLMTALAMIIGMIPMALAMGEAGEQNAPLGRAVIGGLFVATAMTLLVVPVVYTLLRRKPPMKHLLDERFAAEEQQ